MNDITPEIGAYVVKNYLLPMFESDLKKSIRHKKIGSPDGNLAPDTNNEMNTVYGELKLSDQLQL